MDQNAIVSTLLTLACGFVITVAVVAFLFVLVYSTRWDSKWIKMLKEMATQRGWTFQPPSDSRFNCIITGQEDGIPWEIRYWRKRTVGNVRYTPMEYAAVWKTSAPAGSNERILIYPRIPSMPANITLDPNGMAAMVLQFFMSKFGVDISGMTFQPVGSTMFKSKYMVLCQSYEFANRLLAGQVENQLLNWPPVRDFSRLPSIHIEDNTVTVSARREMTPLEVFGDQRMNYERELPDRLVRLGASVVNDLAR